MDILVRGMEMPRNCYFCWLGHKEGGKLMDEFVKKAHSKTNADRIRAMTDEELAKMFAGPMVCPPDDDSDQKACLSVLDCDMTCTQCWLRWLGKEAAGDG